MLKGSLFLGSALIGIGFILTATTFYDKQYIFLAIGLAAIVIGIISIVNYFKKFSKICPKCKYDKMPTINEPEGVQVLQENGMSVKDDSTHHCTHCGYRSDGIVQSKMRSIVLIIFGILTLPFASAHHIIALPGSLILIGVGIYGIWTNYRKSFTCPNCKNKTLVAIDSK